MDTLREKKELNLLWKSKDVNGKYGKILNEHKIKKEEGFSFW